MNESGKIVTLKDLSNIHTTASKKKIIILFSGFLQNLIFLFYFLKENIIQIII